MKNTSCVLTNFMLVRAGKYCVNELLIFKSYWKSLSTNDKNRKCWLQNFPASLTLNYCYQLVDNSINFL